jgi:hypothetical protein
MMTEDGRRSLFVRRSAVKHSAMAGVVSVVVGTALVLLADCPATAQPGPATAPAGVPVGSLRVTGSSWNFDGSVPAGVGPWQSVTVTNTACDRPSMPGTAQAGLIMFTADLLPTPTPAGIAAYQGALTAVQGSMATGHVRVVTPSGDNPISHVDATLYGLGGMAMDNTFTVCLQGATSGALNNTIEQDIQQVSAMGYQVFGIQSTLGPDGSVFIVLAAMKVPTADGYTQWAFMFNGTTYLGTDTAAPSPTLWLSGSPAPGQVNITYANYAHNDPLCCPSLPPQTITYTWNGSSVTPNGTPPGH